MSSATNPSTLWQGAQRPSRDEMTQTQRVRLMRGIIEAVSEKGYTATTVADVLKAARVSRRTFYEVFKDKEDCFASAYTFIHCALVKTVRDSQLGTHDAIDRIEAAHHAYLNFFHREQEAGAAILDGIGHAGQKISDLHTKALLEFAEMHTTLQAQCRRQYPELLLPQVPTAVFIALVAGAMRLVFTEIQAGNSGDIFNLQPFLLYLCYSAYGLWSMATRVSQNWDIGTLAGPENLGYPADVFGTPT